MALPSLSLVIPAYNEAGRLPTGFARLLVAVDEGRVDLEATEVLYVDDGSSDETAQVAAELCSSLPSARVLEQGTNRGKGAAIRRGIAEAIGAQVLFTDADMAMDPRQAPSLLQALERTPVAVGSRAVRGHVDYGSSIRTFAGRSFNRLVRLLSAVDLADTQCGWKALRTAEAKVLFHLTTIDRFAFDVELLARARSLGWDVTEVPVSWSDVTGSHVSLARDSLGMLRDLSIARLRGSRLPKLVGLEVHGSGARSRLAAAASESAVAALPVFETSDGRLVLLAALLDEDAALELLGPLRSTIDGSIRVVGLDEIRSARRLELVGQLG